jgi:hypothetical protein
MPGVFSSMYGTDIRKSKFGYQQYEIAIVTPLNLFTRNQEVSNFKGMDIYM